MRFFGIIKLLVLVEIDVKIMSRNQINQKRGNLTRTKTKRTTANKNFLDIVLITVRILIVNKNEY